MHVARERCAIFFLVLATVKGWALTSVHHSISPDVEVLERGKDGTVWYIGAGSDGVEGVGHVFADGSSKTFPVDSALLIANGPDGNVWFASNDGSNVAISSISSEGIISKKGSLPIVLLSAMSTGPGDHLWMSFVDSDYENCIGWIDDASSLHSYAIPDNQVANTMALGSDGNLWFTQIGSVVRVSVDGQFSSFELPSGPDSQQPLVPNAIAADPAGSLWITANDVVVAGGPPSYSDPSIIQFDVSGASSVFRMPSYSGIENGADNYPRQLVFSSGSQWVLVSVPYGNGCTLVRRDPSGRYSGYPISAYSCGGLISDARGDLWIPDRFNGDLIEVNLPADLIFSDGSDVL